jgi:hypothetical protein
MTAVGLMPPADRQLPVLGLTVPGEFERQRRHRWCGTLLNGPADVSSPCLRR